MTLVVGPLREEHIRQALEIVEEMLRDSTCQIRLESGMTRRPNYETQLWEYTPTGGKTISISIKGGAGTFEESPEEQLARLRKGIT